MDIILIMDHVSSVLHLFPLAKNATIVHFAHYVIMDILLIPSIHYAFLVFLQLMVASIV